MRRSWGVRFIAARRGATAVEFALLATPLFALILAALQFAIVMFFDQALQTATAQAGRLLMVGSAQKAAMTAGQFATTVCAQVPSAFDCSKLMIDVESFNTFSSANTSPLAPTYNNSGTVTNAWSYNPGGPGSIVVVRLMYSWPVISGPFGFGLANQSNGTHLMVGTAVVKNEPYQ